MSIGGVSVKKNKVIISPTSPTTSFLDLSLSDEEVEEEGEDFIDLNFEEGLMDVDLVQEQLEIEREIELERQIEMKKEKIHKTVDLKKTVTGQGKNGKKETIKKTVNIYVCLSNGYICLSMYVCLYICVCICACICMYLYMSI
jgi:hypothetical protein